MQDGLYDFLTGQALPRHKLHKHHIYFGNGRREISECNGFWCYLTLEHHECSASGKDGIEGVHSKHGHYTDLYLKQECEHKYLSLGHTLKEFIELVGENYI